MTGDTIFGSLIRAARTRDELFVRRGGRERRKLNFPDDWDSDGEIRRKLTSSGEMFGWKDVVKSFLRKSEVDGHIPGTTRMDVKIGERR